MIIVFKFSSKQLDLHHCCSNEDIHIQNELTIMKINICAMQNMILKILPWIPSLLYENLQFSLKVKKNHSKIFSI